MTIEVKGANPNGDPLASNMPRTDFLGFGEISDVCIKRKIRNRMQDMGYPIFVQARDRVDDGCISLEGRYKKMGFDKNTTPEDIEQKFKENWLDVRAFGQVITYDQKSIGIRGAVSISHAKTLLPVIVQTMQITKSVNGMEPKKGEKSSDTIGSKHYIDNAVYVLNGSVNAFFAEKNLFSMEDLKILQECLRTLFVNDISTARPDGSMRVRDIFWLEHTSKIGDLSSGKIIDAFKYEALENVAETNKEIKYENYKIHLDEEMLKDYIAKGLKITRIEGE